ncbi:MAG TPA: ABC transporter permease [Terracidiphilus sp.]|jgi:putative ABC transport system permease protein
MRWFDLLAMKVRMVSGRKQAETGLDDELRFHLERQIAENLAAGMSAEQARFAALRSFGNPALLRDEAHASWNWSGLEQVVREVRYGIRTLRHTPGFTLIAIVVMALGIGANVALFTVVRNVLLKPLPFPQPDRLMMLYERDSKTKSDFNIVAGGMYNEWRKQNRSFSNLALVQQDSQFDLSGSGGQLPEKLSGAEVSWNFLSTFGVQPAMGRDFTAGDDLHGATATVLLSQSLWKRRFGSDPNILNQTIYLDAKPYTVIGVMPQWFAYPQAETQVWTPVYQEKPEKLMASLDGHNFRVIGRLKPGVTGAQAIADLSLISLHQHQANLDDPFIFARADGRPLLEHMVGDLKRPLYVLLAATGCLLLIACINVANLLVARAEARRKEMAIRTALGGGRMRLLRERLMESLLLSAGGGALGLVLAFAALQWLVTMRKDMSRVESIHIDATVAAFTVLVIALCAVFAGSISALSVRDKHLLITLHESSRSTRGSHARATLRKTLLSVEVGLTVVLLTGAGLLLKSYERLRSSDMGCATENVLTMGIGLPGARYNTPPLRTAFFQSLLDRVRALPGVDAAGISEAVPGQGYWEDSSFTIVEHPPLPKGTGVFALNRFADPGYFAAMGIPMLHGRTFNDNLRLDRANEIIISEGFVHKYFPGEDPLGKHLHTNMKDYTIVGVVGDTRYDLGEEPMPMKYFPIMEGKEGYGTLVIRSSHDVEGLALPVQRVIQGLDRDMPVADVLTMDQLLGKSTVDKSFNTTLLSGFAALSLLLAAVGLFGVLSYIATQRTGEIGIRLALGAQRQQVLGKMLSDGLRPALIGLALGLAASMEATRLMRDMLYETRPLDPMVFAAVSAMLIAVAALACIVPAWRASRVDPMQALRTE